MSREGLPLGSFLWLCKFFIIFEDLNLIVVVVKIYNNRNYQGLLIIVDGKEELRDLQQQKLLGIINLVIRIVRSFGLSTTVEIIRDY